MGKRGICILAFVAIWIALVNVSGTLVAAMTAGCQYVTYYNVTIQNPAARTSNPATTAKDCKDACLAVGQPTCQGIDFQKYQLICTLLSTQTGMSHNVNYDLYDLICTAVHSTPTPPHPPPPTTPAGYIGLMPGAPSSNGWTPIQQRLNSSFKTDGLWADYKMGFGDPSGNYWMSLDKVSILTNGATYRLRVDMYVPSLGAWSWAQYESFVVDPESNKYTLHVTGYSGNAGDILSTQTIPGNSGPLNANGQPFSTPDQDNGGHYCYMWYPGGWWFNYCYLVDLNSPFDSGNSAGYTGFDTYINGQWVILGQSRMLIQPTG